MDLRSAHPYWLLRHGIISSYPSLDKNLRSDIVVMGAGISGALVAWELTQAGYGVTIVDKRHCGMGSTAASTCLLQYEIDVPLHELAEKVGSKNAERSYRLGIEAIDSLDAICKKVKVADAFKRRPSLQFASFKSHYTLLQKEHKARRKAGIAVDLLNADHLREKFGFSKSGGLYSEGAAEADGYEITHALLQSCINKGAFVYDKTEITDIRHKKNGVQLLTAEGFRISGRKLVIACGYESQQYIPQPVQKLHSTFVIASEPLTEKSPWHQNAIIWETRRPYDYLRTTPDNRILIGGKDAPFTNPRKRDGVLGRKARALETSFRLLFPEIKFRTDFRWAGNFGTTRDGLPYIGTIPERPHTYFALGFGGNGITFSVMAAGLIRDLVKGKKSEDEKIFSFNR